MPSGKTLLEKLLRSSAIKDSGKAMKALERESKRRGVDSFSMAIPQWLAEKTVKGKGRGRAKVQNFMWKNISKPAMTADTVAGHYLGKIPGTKKLFTEKHWVDAGKGTKKLIDRPSALAPLSKARKVAEPFVLAYGAEKGLSSLRDKMKDKQNIQNQGTINKMQKKASHDLELREKVASVMLHLQEEVKGHEKRAQAEKILYRKIELGHELPPLSYSDWQEKIASLCNQDLCVLEKALELSGTMEKQASFGDIADVDPQGAFGNADEKFLAALFE